MFTIDRSRLMSVLNEHRNRAVVAAAGLALFGGLALGDVGNQYAADAARADSAVAGGVAPAGGAADGVSRAEASRQPMKVLPKATEQSKATEQPKATEQSEAAVPTTAQLMPNGVPSYQSSFAPNAEQKANADKIVEVGEDMKLPARAQVIAVATSLQESKLENLGHLGWANDHDSLGLFQQRPSSGWGTPDELTDPKYAARAFYSSLKNVPGYEKMPLSAAAQTVQVSAFPDAYAQWEQMAAGLVKQYHAEHKHR